MSFYESEYPPSVPVGWSLDGFEFDFKFRVDGSLERELQEFDALFSGSPRSNASLGFSPSFSFGRAASSMNKVTIEDDETIETIIDDLHRSCGMSPTPSFSSADWDEYMPMFSTVPSAPASVPATSHRDLDSDSDSDSDSDDEEEEAFAPAPLEVSPRVVRPMPARRAAQSTPTRATRARRSAPSPSPAPPHPSPASQKRKATRSAGPRSPKKIAAAPSTSARKATRSAGPRSTNKPVAVPSESASARPGPDNYPHLLNKDRGCKVLKGGRVRCNFNKTCKHTTGNLADMDRHDLTHRPPPREEIFKCHGCAAVYARPDSGERHVRNKKILDPSHFSEERKAAVLVFNTRKEAVDLWAAYAKDYAKLRAAIPKAFKQFFANEYQA